MKGEQNIKTVDKSEWFPEPATTVMQKRVFIKSLIEDIRDTCKAAEAKEKQEKAAKKNAAMPPIVPVGVATSVPVVVPPSIDADPMASSSSPSSSSSSSSPSPTSSSSATIPAVRTDTSTLSHTTQRARAPANTPAVPMSVGASSARRGESPSQAAFASASSASSTRSQNKRALSATGDSTTGVTPSSADGVLSKKANTQPSSLQAMPVQPSSVATVRVMSSSGRALSKNNYSPSSPSRYNDCVHLHMYVSLPWCWQS